jgi:A/G-specific adenine glycosylase
MKAPSFAARVIRWQSRHGRHDLPWQGSRDPYRVWISEIMLQQTQVAAVVPFFLRFVERFPDVASLARAGEDEVLALWSGLGYYARARNLHRAARDVMALHAGVFPRDFEALAQLAGIGRSTAGAIAAFANGERRAILDGNARRVLARHGGIGGDPSNASVVAQLWRLAEERLPARAIEGYTQGLMDLGATVCVRRPRCEACPVALDCVARRDGRTAELPGRRTKAQRPKRSVAMIVVVSRGEVLLEKRPASGVWGALWSLPEARDARGVARVAEREWGIAVASIEPLAPFEHAFTHFTLEVLPFRVRGRAARAPSPGRAAIWLPLADIDGAALPSPVRQLLRRSAFARAGTGAAPKGAPRRRRAPAASASPRS